MNEIPNFKHGIRKNHSNTKTCIYQDAIEDLDYDECLTYGTKNNRRVLTYKELIDVFNNYNDFRIPYDINKRFSELAINKLERLCFEGLIPSKSKKVLLARLRQIKSSRSNLTKSELDMKKKYEKDSGVVVKVLQMFVEVGMNMRSWDGKSGYPLKSNQTLVEDFNLLETRVRQSIADLFVYVKSNKLEAEFLGLPLSDYIDGCYVSVVDDKKGLTVGDRFEILKDYDNINSCIRTTSNYLLVSASKMASVLGVKSGFDINQLSRIG